MNPISASQMRDLERRAGEEFGITSLTLMENAGRAAADWMETNISFQSAVIFCGKGNNGGDGFVIARCLAGKGKILRVICLGAPEDLKGDAKINFEKLSQEKISVRHLTSNEQMTQLFEYQNTDCVVDALLGTGISKPVTGDFKMAIEWINACGKLVIAVDIPSGLHADTGEALGLAVRASDTLTLGFPKHGLYQGAGPQYAGRLHIIDIGIPEALRPIP